MANDWYFSIDGEQRGPMDDAQAREFARENPEAYCWRPGFAEWLRVAQVGELLSKASVDDQEPPKPPTRTARGRADEIDFKIHGHEMQFVEVELDPGESAVAEAGSMIFKDAPVEMTTVFGDGSDGDAGGFASRLLGAGKRLISGAGIFTTVFNHTGSGKARVAFGAPYPGNIVALNLAELGGTLVCQKDAFLAAAKGVSLDIFFQRRVMTGLFGGEGFIMQRLSGDGWVFVHMGGTVVERRLAPGEVLHVDTGCLAAMTPETDFDLEQAGNVKTMLFGGEGVFFARLRGPGRVWIQSLPFSRLAGRVLANAPKRE